MKGSLSVLPHPPTPHCILIGGGSRVRVSAESAGKPQSLHRLSLPSLPVPGTRFTMWPPSHTHTYSFWWCQIWLEPPYHGDACAQSEYPESLRRTGTEPGPTPP